MNTKINTDAELVVLNNILKTHHEVLGEYLFNLPNSNKKINDYLEYLDYTYRIVKSMEKASKIKELINAGKNHLPMVDIYNSLMEAIKYRELLIEMAIFQESPV